MSSRVDIVLAAHRTHMRQTRFDGLLREAIGENDPHLNSWLDVEYARAHGKWPGIDVLPTEGE